MEKIVKNLVSDAPNPLLDCYNTLSSRPYVNILETAKHYGASVVLLDIGAHFGLINRRLLTMSNFMVCVTDYCQIERMRDLLQMLPVWKQELDVLRTVKNTPNLPDHNVKFIGGVVIKHDAFFEFGVKQEVSNPKKEEIIRHVISSLSKQGLADCVNKQLLLGLISVYENVHYLTEASIRDGVPVPFLDTTLQHSLIQNNVSHIRNEVHDIVKKMCSVFPVNTRLRRSNRGAKKNFLYRYLVTHPVNLRP